MGNEQEMVTEMNPIVTEFNYDNGNIKWEGGRRDDKTAVLYKSYQMERTPFELIKLIKSPIA